MNRARFASATRAGEGRQISDMSEYPREFLVSGSYSDW
jgi:hypothetical protein